MVNISYRAARIQGNFYRSLYSAALPWIIDRPLSQTRNIQVKVYSFSCDRDLPEQVASIRSFIRYVGIPDKFTVISDGSHSVDSCRILQQIGSCVDVVNWQDLATGGIPKYVLGYALNHPHHSTRAMWRRLAVFMSLSVAQPVIYADADILFFPGAEALVSLCQLNESYPWYLPDCQASLDERIILSDRERLNPVNAGFFLLKLPLDWEKPLKRVAQFVDSPIFFTDQSVIHLALHNAQAKPLNCDKFILRIDDQFIYQDSYANQQIAIRHYVNNVRHKFWFHAKT